MEANKALATLKEKEKTEALTSEDRWERARLMRGTQGSAAAMPLLKEIIAVEPDHAGANYTLGEALLEQGDEAGIRYVELALEKEIHATPAGCELIYNFLAGRKRVEEAEPYRSRAAEYYKEIELAQAERTNVSARDEFKHHGLEPDVIRKLQEQFRNHPDLAMVHLVQKVVRHFPQESAYVLGLVIERVHGSDSNDVDPRLMDKLAEAVVLPFPALILPLEKTYKPLLEIFGRLEGSEIYRAERYKANKP